MNRHAQELLAKINAKKSEVKNFAAAGDVAKTKQAKKELDDLQAMFDAVKDFDGTEKTHNAYSLGKPCARSARLLRTSRRRSDHTRNARGNDLRRDREIGRDDSCSRS